MGTQFSGFVLFRKDRAYFKRDALGKAEVSKLRVGKEDLIELARSFDALDKIKVTRSGMWVYDEALYKRLVVYAVTLSRMRRRSSLKTLRLVEAVGKLDDYSLHFWYTEAASAFKRGGLRALGRVSRSLRVLYGVDR